MRHWDALLPGRVLHVPYEQLVEDQEGWSRRLLQHCGLPWDDSVLEFHKTERDVQTASLSQARGCSPGPYIMRWEHAWPRAARYAAKGVSWVGPRVADRQSVGQPQSGKEGSCIM